LLRACSATLFSNSQTPTITVAAAATISVRMAPRASRVRMDSIIVILLDRSCRHGAVFRVPVGPRSFFRRAGAVVGRSFDFSCEWRELDSSLARAPEARLSERKCDECA